MNFVRVKAHPKKDIVFKFNEEDAKKYIEAHPYAAIIATPVRRESNHFAEADEVDAQSVPAAIAQGDFDRLKAEIERLEDENKKLREEKQSTSAAAPATTAAKPTK